MADDRVDVKKRVRSFSDASNSSSGSHGRRTVPEKLVDNTRRVQGIGVAFVDNGASISPGLANSVARKACLLETRLKCKRTGVISDRYLGQAGLIQADRLTDSPPENAAKRQAFAHPEKPDSVAPSLRSSRFAVIPTTCIHNLTDELVQGDLWEFERSELTIMPDFATVSVNFQNTSYKPGPNESVVLRKGDKNNPDPIVWDCYDVTTASKIDTPSSPLTPKTVSFQKVERASYNFHVGQKVGMAVYRNFEVLPEDAGLLGSSISKEDLRNIYGHENRVNIYTGQITRVAPGGDAFEHNINTFRGCSGAIVFLLDIDQDGFGVDSSDYGKAIAVHVGGEQMADGTIANFAFKIH